MKGALSGTNLTSSSWDIRYIPRVLPPLIQGISYMSLPFTLGILQKYLPLIPKDYDAYNVRRGCLEFESNLKSNGMW